MKKYYLTVVLLSICFLSSFCQHSRRDSLQIDSMRSILSSLKGNKRVDCLNSLSEKCIYYKSSYSDEDSRRGSDSMYKYAMMANKEANQIKYKYGIATSLLGLVDSYQVRGPMDSVFKKALKDSLLVNYIRQALSLANEIQNDELLGKVYYSMWRTNAIENYKRAIYHFHKAGDVKMELEVMVELVQNLGLNDSALVYADRSIQLTRNFTPATAWEHELVQTAYANMGYIFEGAGDYETALSYMHQADNYSTKHGGPAWPINLCELYYLMEKYDSAYYYWQTWKQNYDSYYFGHKAYGNIILGKIYIKKGQFDKAIEVFNLCLEAFKKNGKYDTIMAGGLVNPLLYMGEAYYQKNDYQAALSYARQGIYFANRVGIDLHFEGYEILSRIYHQLGRDDSAYSSLLKYNRLKDSIQNKQFLLRLNGYKILAEDQKKEAQLQLLNRDNKIKQQQLKQEAGLKKFLFAILITLILAGIFIFRSLTLKRKNEKLQSEQDEQEWKLKQMESEKKQAELQQQATELEMQALRAQMNPHFIFNCLSSINRFILKNDSKAASNYLTRFSRLIRMVLLNSRKPLITLEDELQMLRLYLDMERLRFKDSFDYVISFLNTMDADNIFIPPLLLQPFCENAIWHGLMHKSGPGKLDIGLSIQNNILNCTITDNGIGREKANELKSKSAGKASLPDEQQRSMGLKITSERLALLNQEKGVNTSYEIEDLKDENGNAAGTKVTLKISTRETEQVLKIS